ncbi:EAL domain-containing protein [Colwellia sp. RSH04]|uniref:EAL domain-containing protein n=1 Tax=Colwellia sp. RSH04 TaxID=2305464 RepID=UPI000E569E17|nr:EAL domain-containing protein [Colwellia sp. RSH04]RHW77564.1 EAL domain-containing protein [Colwellia sp. RSH04]
MKLIKKNTWPLQSCILIGTILCLIFQLAHAKINNLVLEQLTVKDGLSQVSVTYINQDNDGFVWISTEAGVEIYDGYSFKKIEGPDNDFSNYSAGKTVQSENGLIWLLLHGKGLYTFDKKENKFNLVFSNKELTPKDWLIDYVINENQVWIATSKELGVIDLTTNQYTKKVDLTTRFQSTTYAQQILHHNSHIYIASREGVLVYSIDLNEVTKLPELTKQNVDKTNFIPLQANKTYKLAVIDNKLYRGSNDGLFSLDITKINNLFTDKKISSSNALIKYTLEIEHISVWNFFTNKELLVIGGTKGLYQLNTKTKKSRFLFGFDEYDPSFANNTIPSLMVDKDGMYWLVSVSQGILKWNPSLEVIENYGYYKGRNDSLTNNSVLAILADKHDNNIFWVATSNGLNRLDRKTKTVEQFLYTPNANSTFIESNILSLHYGQNNTIWLNTVVGLRLFDIKTKSIISIPFEDDIIEQIKGDYPVYHTQGNVLLLTEGEKFIKLNTDTEEITDLSSHLAKEGIKDIWYFIASEESENEVWLSTPNAIWHYDIKLNKFTQYFQNNDVLVNEWAFIDSFFIDKKNDRIWIAHTSQGIICISLSTKEVLHKFNAENSILDDNLYGLYQDKEGDLWVATHNGVYVLNPETLHIRKFGIHHGFTGMEFNAGAHIKLPTDEIMYGAMTGISIFDPIELKNNEKQQPIKVFVTNVALLTRSLDDTYIFNTDNVIEIAYDDVGIRVDFTTFNFSKNKNILFEYSLLNDSKVDYPPTYKNHIIFPSLSSGRHTLSIKAKSPVTGEYSQPTHIRFNVSYAPWRSPIAIIVYLTIIIVITSAWIRKRTKQRNELLAAHEQVKYRENRLELALKGSNSDVWDWHASNNTFTAKRLEHPTNFNESAYEMPFEEFVNLIHPDDQAAYLTSWHQFIANTEPEDTFSATFRLKNADNQWLWYRDLGKLVELDDANTPLRVTGSYTNITQSKVDEERAQYYGEAFKQTKDWVLIINQGFTKVTSNQAIRNVFGWQEEELDFEESTLGLNKQKVKYYIDIVTSLGVDDYWRGEDLVKASSGEIFHVLIKINVAINKHGDLHYIVVMTDITAQKQAEKELRYMANYDHLTSLPNRSLLIERIEHAIESRARHSSSLAVLFIDLDRFKQINDTLGHDYGDLLLSEVSTRFNNILRQDDTLARLGGDEFVILLEEFKSTNSLTGIAQKLINVAEKPFVLKDTTVSIGASIGIAVYPDDGTDSAELLRNSDIAMYSAKQNGRNNYQFFEASMNEAAAKRLTQETKIKQAVKDKQFINHYQPIVDARYGKAIGVEMLMRWPTDEGMIPPFEFIPLAEDLNLIISMTETALEQALQDLTVWRTYRPEFYLSINVAESHFSKGDLVSLVVTMLEKYQLPASALKIEITESVFISAPETAIEKMKQLKAIGLTLSLDDFGTGFSSLSYLKSFPLDIIKLDRSFISNIGIENTDEAIIEATISLADNLGMRCVAEGAETPEQVDFLVSRQCHYIQGYFYSKPLNALHIEKMLQEDSEDYISTL